MTNRIKYLVIGLGSTGVSCIDYLINNKEYTTAADTRSNPPNYEIIKRKYPNLEIETGNISTSLIESADVIVVSPGISFKESCIQKAIKLKKKVIGDIELFLNVVDAPIIAVTGTNGKTTVTTLLGEMAEKSGLNVLVGGNIGTPVLNLLNEPSPDLYVLELSSFQLQTAYSMSFDVSVLLNITEDHIDHHGSMRAYKNAKVKIFQNCKKAVINNVLKFTPQNVDVFKFSLNNPLSGNDYGIVEINKNRFLANYDKIIMPISKIKIAGTHNQENALAALAAGNAFGLNQKSMISVLEVFEGIEHRCQLIADTNRIKWYNDSKATNVGAAIAAVEGLGTERKNIILIVGGTGKNADFTPLFESVNKYVKKIILFGRDAELICNALNGSSSMIFAEDLKDVIDRAKNIAEAGDIVLFAPACASFDMFKNYEHRGKEFVKAVNRAL